MSKKIALTSIVCVVLGGVAIPGGVVVNDLVQELTYTSIDDGLLGIKRDAGPVVSELVLCTFKAFIMDIMIAGLEFEFSGFTISEAAMTPDKLFNDPNAEFHVDKEAMLSDMIDLGPIDFKVGYVDILTINGLQKYISDEYGVSIDFPAATQQLLLYGNEVLPGIITDTSTGSGVDEFLELYEANVDALSIQYQCSTEALDAVVLYLNEYYENEMIPLFLEGLDIELELVTMIDVLLAVVGLTVDDLVELPPHVDIIPIFMPELAGCKTIDDIAMAKFFDQWANGTLMPYPGFPLPLAHGIEYYGFEAGIPIATGITRSSVDSLWDEKNNFALTSEVGKYKWLTLIANPDVSSDLYNELKIAHGIDDHAMECLINWLPLFQTNLMPYLAEYEYSLPMDSITLGVLLEGAFIITGGAMIGLASTGFISNGIISVRAKRNPPPLKTGYPNLKKKKIIGSPAKPFAERVTDQRIPTNENE